MMKKRLTVILIVSCVLLILGFAVAVPLVNDYSADCVEEELLAIPLPSNTELIESISEAGKLVGNGNGMQYFGAILIKSELSQEELTNYYKKHNEAVFVKSQNGKEIDFLEHSSLHFESEINDSDSYYLVYTFGDGIKPFSYIDLRGH